MVRIVDDIDVITESEVDLQKIFMGILRRDPYLFGSQTGRVEGGLFS